NSNQLKKLFREQYQCSVYEYHISLRMRQAYLLIETGTLPFKEIADMVGYPQYSAFVNYFKTYYNILPKELRMKQHCSEKNKKSEKQLRILYFLKPMLHPPPQQNYRTFPQP